MINDNDIIMEPATGKQYRVWWVSKTRCVAKQQDPAIKTYLLEELRFLRDDTNGIQTYPKSDRKFVKK